MSFIMKLANIDIDQKFVFSIFLCGILSFQDLGCCAGFYGNNCEGT